MEQSITNLIWILRSYVIKTKQILTPVDKNVLSKYLRTLNFAPTRVQNLCCAHFEIEKLTISVKLTMKLIE